MAQLVQELHYKPECRGFDSEEVCVLDGRWKVVANNDREKYLPGHSSETVGLCR